MWVFSGESVNPRSARKATMAGSTFDSRMSLDFPVTTKSSAYRTTFTLSVLATACLTAASNPSSAMFASAGEMMPPYEYLLVMQSIVLKPSSLLDVRLIDFA